MRQRATFPRAAGSEAELLSIDLLEEHARRLAALLSVVPGGSIARRTHFRQLNGHMHALRNVYKQLAQDSDQETLSPAAEWLLDNFHIVSAAAKDVHHDLPPSFYRRLPRVATDEFAGVPRIYALAIELIAPVPVGSMPSDCSASSAPISRSRR
jgi:cyclic beta-1,2-glucan synthetase